MNKEAVTIEDLIDMNEKKGMVAIINDGKLEGFEKDDNN